MPVPEIVCFETARVPSDRPIPVCPETIVARTKPRKIRATTASATPSQLSYGPKRVAANASRIS
jgi:hypothetical protein